MCDPLPLGKKARETWQITAKLINCKIIGNPLVFTALMLTIFGSMLRLFDSQQTFYAKAQASTFEQEGSLKSPLFENEPQLFESKKVQTSIKNENLQKNGLIKPICETSEHFANKIYDLVGDAPIKEMVPYISKRDQKVAAFLIGIAKKESSFGLASPSKDGKTCYNYWGYKGVGGRGEGMGYACFASAEEAVDTVGDRIEVLVQKNRTTPAKMVDTWKCGTSCAGDPGAPSWVATVSLYFEKLVS